LTRTGKDGKARVDSLQKSYDDLKREADKTNKELTRSQDDLKMAKEFKSKFESLQKTYDNLKRDFDKLSKEKEKFKQQQTASTPVVPVKDREPVNWKLEKLELEKQIKDLKLKCETASLDVKKLPSKDVNNTKNIC